MTSSARSRFLFTVGMNVLRAGIGFATGMLVARWLGPSLFGDMSFLLGTFAGVRTLLDMGTSAAFFTFLSQRPRSRRFVQSFLGWLLAQFVIPLLAIGLLFPSRWIASIWSGEPRSLVVIAFIAAFMQLSVWPVAQQAGESQRRTYLVQAIGVGIVLLHLAAVIALWRLGVLGLYAILAAIAIEYSFAAALALSRFNFAPESEDEKAERLLHKYMLYCYPLIPYAAAGFASQFADRWLLQRYGGGVQQAFYSVGAQIASIALIATTSVLNIFWKEIAEAHHRSDHERTRNLYRRVTRLLFFLGAVVAGFLIPWSEFLLRILLGAAYSGGATALMLMLLYPIHQSMGQITGTMMYATERVGQQVAIGTGTMLFGIITTYLVLAPSTAAIPGLGLASTGLALKMVVTQILSANLLAFAIARAFKWPFDWIFQPVVLIGCVFLGGVAEFAINHAVTPSVPILVRLGMAAGIYLVMIIAFVFVTPDLAGLSREEVVRDLNKIRMTLGVSRSG
jgi:O-antigen/teichoic acid export membrane protein